MSCNWPLATLGDFTSLFTGFPFKSNQFSDVEGTNLLRGDNVAQGTIRWENAKRWTTENVIDKHQNYLLRKNDVILAMDRPWIEAGLKFAQVEEKDLPCYLVQRVACLRANDPDDQDFLKFIIGSRAFTEYVKLVQTGTAVPHISGKQILAFEFRLPPKHIRLSIGKTLSDLDRKISINTQSNQTLEAMAQAIFKSWFVDFDPVKAKMNGKQPQGMDEATASLFPDKLVESELGSIPEGWEFLESEQVATVGIGKTPPRKEPQWFTENSADVTWISIKDMGKAGAYAFDSSEYLTQEAVERFNVKVIPDNTLILSFKLTVGRVAITHGEMTTNEAIAHYRLSPDSRVSTNYLYLYMKLFNFESLGSTSSIATAINSKIIKALPVLVPTKIILDSFEKLVQPIFGKIKSNQIENSTLEKLRDELLPKLLSGDIELGQTEEMAEVS
ncbi:restriction endonuclease subunit S [Shewanella mangrovisoli]|uniref:restriction endonuclease subunit S n=1 Tax=Shewanella mangrovisoli TaxID=2864211 RepID=UPI0035B93D89